jgi:hypothetical protein
MQAELLTDTSKTTVAMFVSSVICVMRLYNNLLDGIQHRVTGYLVPHYETIWWPHPHFDPCS